MVVVVSSSGVPVEVPGITEVGAVRGVEVEVALQARVVQVVQVQFTMAILVELAEPPEQVHLEEQLVEQEEMIKVKPRHSMAVMDQHQELAVEE